MSRHEVPAKAPGDVVFVGWDRPLYTFFGQVYRASVDDDENPVFWVGADRPRELLRAEDLALKLAPYATLSDHILATLRRDKDANR